MRGVWPWLYSSAALNSARVVMIPPALAVNRAADVGSFLERGVQQIIHRGCRLVARHKALAKIASEVVVGSGRACLDNATDSFSKSLLHSLPWKLCDDSSHVRLGQ